VDYQRHKQRCHPDKINATENSATANNDDALERLTVEALKNRYNINTYFIQWDYLTLPNLNEPHEQFLSLLVSWSKNQTTSQKDNFQSWILRHLRRVYHFIVLI